MGFLIQRAVALAVIAVFAGAPAIEGLCAALCPTSVPHGAHHAVPAAQPTQSASHAATPRVHEHGPVGTHSGTARHDALKDHDHHDATTAVVVVTAVDANCCVDPSVTVMPAVSGARQDASVIAASADAAPPDASLAPLSSQRWFDAPPRPAVSPPSPTRAPLVLRI